jgi:hypothetical protein
MCKYQAQLPATVKPGDVVRFNALGRFICVEAYVSNGLGMLFTVQRDGSLRRLFY